MTDQIITKTCNICNKTKAIDQYTKKTENRLKAHCKSCACEISRKYRSENKEKIQEKDKIYKKNHRAEISEKGKIYHEKKTNASERAANKKLDYFNKFKSIVEQNGGVCLASVDDYVNNHTKIAVKCQNGHTWKIAPDCLYNG